jgi:hypothetical protein
LIYGTRQGTRQTPTKPNEYDGLSCVWHGLFLKKLFFHTRDDHTLHEDALGKEEDDHRDHCGDQ